MLKHVFFFLLSLSFLFPTFSTTALSKENPDDRQNSEFSNIYNKLPLYFIQNKGQVDQNVAYFEMGKDHATYFTPEGIYLKLIKKGNEATWVKLSLQDANKTPTIIAEDLQPTTINYLRGGNPGQWQKNVPTYGTVRYEDIYEGIDIRFYGNNRELEYDIIVEPGIDPSVVKFSYEGIQGLKVNAHGELEVLLENGKLIQRSPYIYQEINGHRVEIEGVFELIDKIDSSKSAYGYRFELAAYDKSRPLIIDPILDYSTFLGGSDNGETGIDIAVDSAGNAYVTGTTLSADFLSTSLWPASPSPTTLQSELDGGIDIFVTKFNATGTAILYSTFLGGSADDEVTGIALDASGNVYITGKTLSSDFPLQAAIQTTRAGGNDAFVAKIDASGSNLLYATYLGGGAADISHGIAVDSSGAAYITGETSSGDFPTGSPNNTPFQANRAGASSGIDAFISKINPAGTALVYSTYLGGSIQDYAYAIAIDTEGNAYVTGKTASLNFPTSSDPAPYQKSKAGLDEAFVVKMNPEGEALVYSTYLGGSGNDDAKAIAVDGAGFAYVAGRTASFDFPLVSAFQTTKRGIWDAFFTKINPTGTAIIYSSLFGGNGNELIHDIAVNTSGSLFLVGETDSAVNFPIFAPASSAQIQENHGGGGNDAFISRVNAAGTTLIYSTYLGGSLNDESYGIAIDSVGSVYTTGKTGSGDFPTESAIQVSRPGGGDGDAFVSKISHLVLGAEIQVTDNVLPADDLQIGFGDLTTGTTRVESLTITNIGDTALDIGSIATTNPLAAPFSIENDLCSNQTLISSESCVLEIHFSPMAEASSSDDFDIPSNDADENPITITLAGRGVPLVVPTPDIDLSRLTVAFGDVSINTTRDETLTITNTGEAALILGQIASANALLAPFSILSDLCSGQTLSKDATCTIEIRFSPTAEAGANDAFNIPSNDPDEDPVTIVVSGTGTISRVARIDVRDSAAPDDDLKIPFGSVTTGENSVHRVTIENLGNEALIIGGIAQNNALLAPYSLQNDGCSGMTLATNSTCIFDILFSPISVLKPLDSFDLPSNDPNRSVVTLSLSGNGVSGPAPDLRILQGNPPSPSQSIVFPEIAIGQKLEEMVTLTNIGSATLEIGTIPRDNLIEVPFSLVEDQCSGKSLLFFETCTFKVRFAPISTGLFSDAFDIASNDPDGAQVFSLNGSAVQNAINNPPSKPILRFPANGQQGLGTDLRFEWERATDSDGDPITYTLLVCDDPDPTVCNAALEVSKANREKAMAFSYSAGFFLVGIVFFSWGLPKKRGKSAKAGRLTIFFLAMGIFLVACSSSGGGGGAAGGGETENETGRLENPLQTNTKYYWQVIAKDDQGGETSSDIWNFTTQ